MEEKEKYANEAETLYTSNPKHYASQEHRYWNTTAVLMKKLGLITLQNIGTFIFLLCTIISY